MTDRAADLTIPDAAGWSELGEPLRRLLHHHAEGETGAVVVATSGSSGAPKRVRLSASALRASAQATAEVLGDVSGGQWLLALPTRHVAGLQVLVRSALAGTTPVELDQRASFTAAGFAAAVGRMDDGRRRYASLVPTQLRRALADPEGVEALLRLDAVLVGGAAADTGLLTRARGAGVKVVTTYGMSETCGGCVYDGRPLPGVRIAVDDDGLIRIGGPVLADGYVDDPGLTAERFVDEGTRWFVTGDRGELHDSHLVVLGRADDVIVTGGHKVEPGDVEAALLALPEVAEALVLGVPDAEWGERVSALVTLTEGEPGAAVPGRLTAVDLPPHAVPKQVEVVDGIPLLPSGKPDRAAARRLLDRGGRMGSPPP
ncbi:o-succinylbenzoate--CoA ligase [Serinicoccus kebangsaanensis]|uniref:o-succinylbenzoate--CoA ligase n=1 Tax=Serinicoccus kebangsaanensis TaxID=2602069 RepID=UPI00124E2BCD|nr:o-succinylbenzoate--CoA ligase [Serinicoccus kebangsaanensis]